MPLFSSPVHLGRTLRPSRRNNSISARERVCLAAAAIRAVDIAFAPRDLLQQTADEMPRVIIAKCRRRHTQYAPVTHALRALREIRPFECARTGAAWNNCTPRPCNSILFTVTGQFTRRR